MASATRPPPLITLGSAPYLVFLCIGRVIFCLCVCQGVCKGPWLRVPSAASVGGAIGRLRARWGLRGRPCWENLKSGRGNLPLLSKDLGAVVKEESQAFHKRKVSLPLLAGEVLPQAMSLTISPAHLRMGSSGKEAQGVGVGEMTWNK